MNLLRHSLAILLLLGTGLALAHAELESATPAQNSVVNTLPTEITLTFSEEVEVGFSLFKVYKLDETAASADTTTTEATSTATTTEATDTPAQDEDHQDEGHAASADATPLTPEQLRLNGLAGAMVSQVLETRDDEAARADAGTATTEATSKTVTLNLKPDLSPGTYVVMWRALSVDTHSEDGYYVFTYQPTSP